MVLPICSICMFVLFKRYIFTIRIKTFAFRQNADHGLINIPLDMPQKRRKTVGVSVEQYPDSVNHLSIYKRQTRILIG